MDRPLIEGTDRPDTPLNRASYWYDEVKPEQVTVETREELDEYLSPILEQLRLSMSPEEVVIAANFYGASCTDLFTKEHPEGTMDQLVKSTWLDGFLIGLATGRDKHGEPPDGDE